MGKCPGYAFAGRKKGVKGLAFLLLLPVHLSTYPSHLPTCSSVHLPSANPLSVHLSVYLAIHPSVHHPSFHYPTTASVYISRDKDKKKASSWLLRTSGLQGKMRYIVRLFSHMRLPRPTPRCQEKKCGKCCLLDAPLGDSLLTLLAH